MRAIIITLFLMPCSSFSESAADTNDPECSFDFISQPTCLSGDMRVVVKTKIISKDEKELTFLEIEKSGVIHSLKITAHASMVNGDKGMIIFEDINFDGLPDIAVNTSFGVANLYMDYWIYDQNNKKFFKIGNHNRFNLDRENKTLSNTEKINAAKYKKNVYIWQGSQLIKKTTTD